MKDKQHYLELFKKMKDKQKEKVNRGLSVRITENKILDEFLKENDITLPSFIMFLLKKDGVLNDELLDAYFESYPRAKKDFLEFNENNFTFEFKKKYSYVDFEDLLKNEKNIVKGFNLSFVIDQEVKENFTRKNFITFIQYIKYLFNKEGVYPDIMYKELQKYIRTDYLPDEKRTDKYIRKQALAKKRRKQKDMKIVPLDQDVKYKSAAFTTKEFEKIEIIDPFIAKLRKKGITFSQLIRYELVQNGLLDLSDAFLDKKTLTKIKNFTYKVKKPRFKEKADYKIQKKLSDKYVSTMITLPNNDKLLQKIKNSLGMWIRHFILLKYGAYPKFGVRNVSSYFINENRIKDFLKEE